MPFIAPQFEGGGDAGQAFNAGQNSGMSMMERAQQMEQRGAQEERQKAIFQAAMPVLQAKNQADIATANATINHVVQTQNLMTKAAQASGDLNTEFQDIMQLEDYDEKDRALSSFQAKTAWLGQLPAYKPFVEAVNGARVENYKGKMADMKITGDIEVAKANSLSRQTVQGMRGDTAENIAACKAETALSVEDKKATAAKELETMRGNTKSLIAGGMTPIKVAEAYTSLADSEEKNAAMLKLTGDEEGYKARIAKAQTLRTEAENTLKGSASASDSHQKNVTPEEYAKIPSGSKYWWNGQEITKK